MVKITEVSWSSKIFHLLEIQLKGYCFFKFPDLRMSRDIIKLLDMRDKHLNQDYLLYYRSLCLIKRRLLFIFSGCEIFYQPRIMYMLNAMLFIVHNHLHLCLGCRYLSQWDQFHEQVGDIAARVPYMVTKYVFSGTKIDLLVSVSMKFDLNANKSLNNFFMSN